MAIILKKKKTGKKTTVAKDVEKLDPQCIDDSNVKYTNTVENSMAISQKIKVIL